MQADFKSISVVYLRLISPIALYTKFLYSSKKISFLKNKDLAFVLSKIALKRASIRHVHSFAMFWCLHAWSDTLMLSSTKNVVRVWDSHSSIVETPLLWTKHVSNCRKSRDYQGTRKTRKTVCYAIRQKSLPFGKGRKDMFIHNSNSNETEWTLKGRKRGYPFRVCLLKWWKKKSI